MRFRFEEFELSSSPPELRRHGVSVPVQPKVLDLLLVLARGRGALVSERALSQELWPGLHVDPATLRRLVKEARRAVGDDGDHQRVLRTERGRGYRFAVAPTVDLADQALFVGRQELVRELVAALEAARGNRGRLHLLEGAAGIGKTRTALELCDRARALGATAVFVACGVAEGSPPLAPWVAVVRELIGQQRLDSEALPPPLRDALAGAAASGGTGELSPAAATSARLRFLESLDTALSIASGPSPLLVAFDDLHVADADTLRSLVFLAPRMLRRRVTLLGGYRPEALVTEHAEALGEVARSPYATVHALVAFDLLEIEALIEQSAGERGWTELAQFLLRLTSGNPFWVQQILRDLAARKRLARNVDTGLIEADVSLLLRPVLRRRLAAVSPSVDRWLRFAAAIGREFELPLLARAASCSSEDLARGLAEAQRTDLVQQQRSAPSRWVFTHDLVREVLYEELRETKLECAQVHLRIVEALEERRDRTAAEVAHHAERATPLIDRSRVVELRTEAARAAAAGRGYEDAAMHLERAIAQLDGNSPATDARRCQLLLSQANALVASRGRDTARPKYRAAALAAERCGDAETFARAALGFAQRRTGLGAFERETADLLERARDRVGPEQRGLALRLKSRFGAERVLQTPREIGEAMVEEAVEEARAFGDIATLGWVLDDYSYAFWGPRDTRTWAEICREIEQIGERLGDSELRFRGARFRAVGALELGDRAEFLRALGVCEEINRESPLPYTRAILPALHSTLALLDGRLPEAQQFAEEAASLGHGATESGFEAIAGVLRLEIARAAGGPYTAFAPAVREDTGRWGALAGPRMHRGVLLAEVGERVAARALLAEFVRDALPSLPRDRLYLPTLYCAVEICLLAEGGEFAATLERALMPFAEIGVSVGATGPFLGAIAHHLGALALARGARIEAIARLEAGAAFHARLGASLWLAKSRALLERAMAE